MLLVVRRLNGVSAVDPDDQREITTTESTTPTLFGRQTTRHAGRDEIAAPQTPYDAKLAAIDVGAAYRGVRERVTALLTGIHQDGWNTVVPHCPEWTVRQTLAHLVGVVDDAVSGNLGGAGTDEWTKVQVDKRADISGPQLLDDWNTYAPFVEDRFTKIGLAGAQDVFDVVTHEHDLRFAFAAPGARDSDAVWVGIAFIQGRISEKTALEMMLDGIIVPCLGVTPTLQLEATAFDALRTFSSRRTEAEIRALKWSADPSVVVGAVPFALPTQTFGA